MELTEETSKFGVLCATVPRNLSSSSSAFVSACQSPFFSPRSPKPFGSELTQTSNLKHSVNTLLNGHFGPSNFVKQSKLPNNLNLASSHVTPIENGCSNCEKPKEDFTVSNQLLPSTDIYSDSSSDHSRESNDPDFKRKQRRKGKIQAKFSFMRGSTLLSSTKRPRTCDVYIGFHGRKPSLLRFSNWLRAELEYHGISCFASDRARCKSVRSKELVARAMNASSFGVIILTKKSFGNRYTMEELQNFLSKKNLVPVFFDLGANDCIARDIIERRGELWDRHGGELWTMYGGQEMEWKETLDGLMRIDNLKLEAHDGHWRDCILNAITLLATRLGRRSAVDRVNRWREKVEKEEFPLPRNEDFVGRKKEISELELILFGDISGDGEGEFFELKPKIKRKSLIIRRNEYNPTDDSGKDHQSESSSKGKSPVLWKESEKEIEMQKLEIPHRIGKHGRKKRSIKASYRKGIACVSGDSGIGKTELVLEYAYRYSQKYKMILWIGGETRYVRQNFLNLRSFLDVDVSQENHCLEKDKARNFEKQEEEAITRVRKEFMRDIPFLVVIDNLENEKDWWDKKMIIDLLPRFGGETHFIITTRLPRVMSLEPLKLSFMSSVEAITLMRGSFKDYPISEIDALRVIEERLGRLTLGLGIVGAILSELSITPSRLLNTIIRTPLRDWIWNDNEAPSLKRNTFLLQLLEVCFSIFDHADGPSSLASKMVQVSGWFAPSAIPTSLLALAASRITDRQRHSQCWKKFLHVLTCSFIASRLKKSETEASSILVRFGIARTSTKAGHIHIHELIKLYARKRGTTKAAQAMIYAVSLRGSISQHCEHLWAACFLLFGFGSDPVVVEQEPSELMFLVKRVVLPLSIHTFITFSRCNAALELLRLCTDALEMCAESLLSRSEKWCCQSFCCTRHIRSDAEHTYLWQELALLKATVLETRTKLLLRGGQYDAGDDLIRKAIFIRTSICGEHHPDTLSAQNTLSKIARLLTNTQCS